MLQGGTPAPVGRMASSAHRLIVMSCPEMGPLDPYGEPPYDQQVMVKVAMGEGENLRALGAKVAKQRGLALLCAARRVELTRLMRAKGDEQFIAHQRHMRRAGEHQPVPSNFVRSLRRVTADDMAKDSAWRFAPIGVLSHVERDCLNLEQLHAFACEFDLPLVRWRLPLVDDAFADKSVREDLYENEPNLWGYFVEGAPAHLLQTIKSVRKLVNGSPVLLDSLQVKSKDDRRTLTNAYKQGYNEGMVMLSEPPEAVNVVVGAQRRTRACGTRWSWRTSQTSSPSTSAARR